MFKLSHFFFLIYTLSVDCKLLKTAPTIYSIDEHFLLEFIQHTHKVCHDVVVVWCITCVKNIVYLYAHDNIKIDEISSKNKTVGL